MTSIREKIICCNIDMTTACRIISFLGLLMSVVLMSVLLNDKYNNDFGTSRTTALALGLDWQHFHPQANATHHADPEGRLITFIVVFYSIIFLMTNVLLLCGSITYNRLFTIPWLACEFLGCVSKIGALIYHWCTDLQNISRVFLVGSIIYVVLMVWWWFAVLIAQQSWKFKTKISMCNKEIMNSFSPNIECQPRKQSQVFILQDPNDSVGSWKETNDELMLSPGPYRANQCYSMI